MGEPAGGERRVAEDRVRRLLDADAAYEKSVSRHYDEVVGEVIARVGDAGSVGKLDIAALTGWKRLRADTPWIAGLMGTSDAEVRRRTGEVVAIVNDAALPTPEAAGRARGVLMPLPGFRTGDALASAVCFVAAPGRLCVYDRRAHDAVHALGFDLDRRRGCYRRFTAIVETLRAALYDAGNDWNPRRVDTALYQLGGPGHGTAD